MSREKLYFPGELKFSFVSIKNNYNYIENIINVSYCFFLNTIRSISEVLFVFFFFFFHPLVSVNFVVAPSGDNHPANNLHN